MKRDLMSVLRNVEIGGCNNNGLSERVTSGQMFWDCTREEAIEWCKENNRDPEKQFYLVNRILWDEDHSYAEPLVKPEGMAQTAGANFLYTCNGGSFKFKGEKCTRPIPIHDRFETWEDFDTLSK